MKPLSTETERIKDTILKFGLQFENFEVNEAGVFRIKESRSGKISLQKICSSPVYITGRGYDIDTEEVYLKLLWMSIDNAWHEEFFPQAQLYTKRGDSPLL